MGKLSLIDLAGSERGTATENRGERLREGAKINTSLLALANCINALGDKSKRGQFIAYRNSKLTRMLKDSLGGNCRTVMIVTISPSSNYFEETVNTLKYAQRAKNIKTKPVENKRALELQASEYKSIIKELREEIEDLRERVSSVAQLTEEDYCGQCKGSLEEDLIEMEKVKIQVYENVD